MPIVDLDDELSIVEETDEEQELPPPMLGYDSEMDNSVYTGTSGLSRANSEDEREQQWIIDSILGHQDSSGGILGSEMDDNSLYTTDTLDSSPTRQLTPKVKNARKKSRAAPSPNDADYHNYMDVSGIVDNFGEVEEEEKGWKKKVLGGGKNKKVSQDSKKAQEQAKEKNSGKGSFFGRKKDASSSKTEEAKSTPPPKDGWRNKFRANKSNKKTPSQEPSKRPTPQEPYEANLAPLGGIDDVGADVKANDDTNHQEGGWMSKVSSLVKSAPEEEGNDDDFDFQYGASVAPLGAVRDVEANATVAKEEDKPEETRGGWGSRMGSLFSSSAVEPKQEEPKEESKADDEKSTTSSIGLTDSIAFVDDILGSLTVEAEADEKEEVIDEEKGVVAEATQAASEETNQFAEDTQDVTDQTNPVAEEAEAVSEEAQAIVVENKAVSEETNTFAEETQVRVSEETTPYATEETQPISEATNPFANETQPTSEENNPFAAEETPPVSKETNPFAEETEGSSVGANTKDNNEEDGMVVVPVNDQTEIQEGSADKTESNNTWKSKVKSVRKKGSSTLSSIRKSTKSFTKNKMNAMDVDSKDSSMEAVDHSTVSTTGGSGNANSSVEKNKDNVRMTPQRWRAVAIGALVILFIALIVGISVGVSKKDDSPEVEVPPEEIAYLYDLLYPISGDDLTVEDPDSPQVQAFVWVAEDSMVRGDGSDEDIILRYVSAVVYYSLSGENWTNQYNFLSHDDICSWNDAETRTSGIICSDGEVFELQLADNNLSGNIPDEIRHLTALRSIHMEGNGITGTLPTALGQLDWLEELDLSSNLMAGTIPYTLYVNQLRDVALNDNDFTGTLNSLLGNSPVLQSFSAYGNSLSGPVPPPIGQSSALKIVDLSDNALTGTIPTFKASAAIERLYLGSNKLEGRIPNKLAEAPQLVSLHLHKNSLTGPIPDFTEQNSLRHLELHDNEFTGDIDATFENLPLNIERVILSNNEFAGTIPSAIGDYDKLVELRLERNSIDGTIPRAIGELTALRDALYLTGNNLEGPIPTEIGNLSSLTTLRMRMNSLTGFIPSELGALTLLKDILLDGNNLEGDIPEEIASIPTLISFLLSENAGITGGAEPFCARQDQLDLFGVNTCDDDAGADCRCCNICCKSDADGGYGCFKVQ